MTRGLPVVIVGDGDDPHVSAVVERILDGSDVALIDAASLAKHLLRMDNQGTSLQTMRGNIVTFPVTPTASEANDTPQLARGWIRRLAPAGWDDEVRIGSREGASAASRLIALAAIVRTAPVEWLTAVDALFAAENKLVQYRVAQALGIAVPPWAVTTSLHAIRDAVGDEVVLKPLGPGQYSEKSGERKAVYVDKQELSSLDQVPLLSSPFIAQHVVAAEGHLRIVTVNDQAWVAHLPGQDLPVDWRRSDTAHYSFRHTDSFHEVAAQALALALELGVGYSSQDWILAGDQAFFVDLNPGGQWLFLPDAVAEPATRAVAQWLMGTS